MRAAYRLFILATLAVLAYGVVTAAHRDHPWWIAGPALVLAVVGAIKTPKRDSTPSTDSA